MSPGSFCSEERIHELPGIEVLQIVDGLAKLSAIGLDGLAVSWARYIDDMRMFQRETLPLLKQAGLR